MTKLLKTVTLSNGNTITFKLSNTFRTGLYLSKTGKYFALELQTKTTDNRTLRHYLTPKFQTEPNFELWDNLQQCFVPNIRDKESKQKADSNNDYLCGLLQELENLGNDKGNNIKDGKDLKELYEKRNILIKQNPEHRYNFLDCTRRYINKLKANNKDPHKKHSTTYQRYDALYNKLKQQKDNEKYPRFADIPINNMTNEIYSLWCHYVEHVLKLKDDSFDNTVKYFAAVYNHMCTDTELKIVGLNYIKFHYDRTIIGKRNKNGIVEKKNSFEKALSENEIKAIDNFSNTHTLSEKEQLLLDTCMLQYYLATRPKDIVLFNWDDIKKDGNKWFWEYTPYKLRNNKNPKKVCLPIPEAAITIIEKYKQCKTIGNYVLPLPCNTVSKDYNNEFDTFEYLTKKTAEKINVFLKRIDCVLRLDGFLTDKEPLSMYSFRHSRITHLVSTGKLSADQIALLAGTSVDMIYKHYISEGEVSKNISDIFRNITI